MTPDFSTRSTEAEIIDDMSLDAAEMHRVLKELGVVNRFLGGYATTIAGVEDFVDEATQSLRVLDVGAGGGDTAHRLVDWGRRRGIRVSVVCVDLSFAAVAFARDALATEPRASVIQADVLALPFADASFDVAVCSLFLHHFVQADAARIVASMARVSRLGVVINDLHRHPLAYYAILGLTRILGASPIVRNDGPLSVMRAFRRRDFEEIARSTGLTLEPAWRWAFRWRVLVRTPGGIER